MMCDTILAGSINDHNGMRMIINDANANSEAESRGSFWDDAE